MKKLALVTTLISAATGAYAETAKPAPEAAAPAVTTPAPAKKEHKANHAAKAKHTEVKAEEAKPVAEKMK